MPYNYILIVLVTYITMECITWLTHKFVMHGFLWYLHEDHHHQDTTISLKKMTYSSSYLLFQAFCYFITA